MIREFVKEEFKDELTSDVMCNVQILGNNTVKVLPMPRSDFNCNLPFNFSVASFTRYKPKPEPADLFDAL